MRHLVGCLHSNSLGPLLPCQKILAVPDQRTLLQFQDILYLGRGCGRSFGRYHSLTAHQDGIKAADALQTKGHAMFRLPAWWIVSCAPFWTISEMVLHGKKLMGSLSVL